MSKLVSIKTYEVFKSLWDNNNINELSLNFIVDTLQLYTHGMFINSATFGTESSNTIPLTIAGVSKTLALSGHTHSNYYDKTADLDIGNYSIVSGNNELLKATGGSLYLGNVSNPTYISGNHLYSIRGLNTYTILDTGNFEVTNKDSNGYTYYNKAIIKYGTSFEIDYVKRDNSLTSLDNLHNYTSAGTTKVNNVTYGFITLRTDTEFSNPSWAQLRIDIPGLTVQFRTSVNPNNWKDITVPTINLNALNVAGIVKAPSSSTTNKVWKTDENGNPDWRDDNNSLYSLTLNGTTKGNTGGTDLGAFYAVATSNASEANQVWMRNSDNTAYAWRTLGSRAFDSTAYLPLTGGTMTGNISFSGDNDINWTRNTDYAKIYFKNTGDGDSDSYLGFETADNGNEYFRFGHTSGTYTEWMSIKSDGVRVKGTKISLEGHTHDYLPLSGGILTNGGWGLQLTLKRQGGTPSLYFDDGNYRHYIYPNMNKDNEWHVGLDNNDKNYILYHTGNLPAYPTKASWNYDDVYLKLTGGELTGLFKVNAGSTIIGCQIDSDTYKYYHTVYWGAHGVDHMDFYESVFNFYGNGGTTPTLKVNGNTVWHAGNLTPGNYVLKAGDTMSGALLMSLNAKGVLSVDSAGIYILSGSYWLRALVGGVNDCLGALSISNYLTTSAYANIGTYLQTGTYAYIKGVIANNNYKQVRLLGQYTNPGSWTGTIKITLPNNSSQYQMHYIRIHVYEYSSQGASTITLGGHDWNGNWYNYNYTVKGNYNKGVRLGYDGTNYCILLGTTSTTWSYPGVWVDALDNVYNNDWDNVFLNGCTCSLITSESGITTFSPPLGNSYASTFYGALSGNASSASKLVDSNSSSNTITASYASGGYTSSPAYLTAWSGYHLTYCEPKYVAGVGSANKLTTARNLWGNTFDGTLDLTRRLTIQSDIRCVPTDSSYEVFQFGAQNNGAYNGYIYGETNSYYLVFLSGNTGVGVSPTAKLDVNGIIKCRGHINIDNALAELDITFQKNGASRYQLCGHDNNFIFYRYNGSWNLDALWNYSTGSWTFNHQVAIFNNSDTPAYLKSTSGNTCFIGYLNSSGSWLGWLGYNSSGEPIAYLSDIPYRIIHTGNYTSYFRSDALNDSRYVLKSGDTMTGTLIVNAGSSKFGPSLNSDTYKYYHALYLGNHGIDLCYFYESDFLFCYNGGSPQFKIEGSVSKVTSVHNIYAPNFYTTSDRLKKQNISSFSEHIRKFQLKDTEKWHYGVIALEVQEMFREGEEGNMTVNYNSVLSYYVGLLENRVKELENEILKLKSK